MTVRKLAKSIRFNLLTFVLNGIYLATSVFVLPALIYSAIVHGKYRSGWSQKLWGLVPSRVAAGQRPCVWLHGVSVGEINLLQPILQQIDQEYPECECVISTTTQAAYRLAQTKFASNLVFYCPLDFSWAIRNAVRRIRPQMLVLCELEVWPNLIRICNQQAIPVSVVNARLSEKSFQGYSRIRFLIGPILRQIRLVAAQNEIYAHRFLSLGANRQSTFVTGSIKFDGAETDRANPTTSSLRDLAGIQESDIVMLAGSTQTPEELMALNGYIQLRNDFPNLRLVIVPRHPERFDAVAKSLANSGIRFSRRSELSHGSKCERVLLVDTIGELSAWWGVASIAFVGGSMGHRGGQNMIEPAAYGAAVCFGPNTKNFRDVVGSMLRTDAARVVQSEAALTAFVRKCLENPKFATGLGDRAGRLVRENSGALAKTMSLLKPILDEALAKSTTSETEYDRRRVA